MQISRRFLLACIATAIFFPSVLQAQDTEAQRKAREALESTIRAAEGQPPAAELVPIAPAAEATPAVPPPSTPAPAQVSESQPSAAQSAPAIAAPPAVPAASAEAIERAREALREKMGQPAPSAPPTVQAPPTTDKAKTKAEAEMVKTDAKVEAAIQQAVVNSEKAAADKAQAEKAAAAQAQAEGKPVAPKTSKPKTTAPVAQQPQSLPLQPMQGPPTGFASSKEQRLNELLQQYRSDTITAEQYHAERAKVLAAP